MTSDERCNREELWMAVFGARLTRFMEEQKISVSELSRETGISYSVIRNYMKGRTSPKAFNVYLIAKVLKFSFDDFLDL